MTIRRPPPLPHTMGEGGGTDLLPMFPVAQSGHETGARSATRVTCELCPCLSRFSRESRPSRLSQASAIAAEVFMHKVSGVSIYLR